MIPMHIVTRACVFALIALFPLAPALAQDQLKVAIGQINNWENQAPTLGQDAGIFKKRNLTLENFGTAGAGETLQPVIAGSADIGAGVGVAGAMRAFSRGAPVRILLPAFTGTADLYWYVKADSPIKSLKDATASNTIAYSTSGSSSNNLVIAFVEELGAKAKPTATGSPPGTLTAVMSGQIDIGWAAPPFGLKEIEEGKIRIVARGSDVMPKYLRLCTVTTGKLIAARREDAVRFLAAQMQGYRHALANREEELRITREITGIKADDPRPEFMFAEAARADTGIDPRMPLDMNKLTWLQEQLVKAGNLAQPYDLGRIVNNDIRGAALARAGLQQ